MGKRDIDKYFEDKLKTYSKEIDTDAIWSNIDLDEKKKKRPFVFWLTGLFILLVLALVYFNSDRFDEIKEPLLTSEENTKGRTMPDQETLKTISEVTEKLEEESTNDLSNVNVNNVDLESSSVEESIDQSSLNNNRINSQVITTSRKKEDDSFVQIATTGSNPNTDINLISRSENLSTEIETQKNLGDLSGLNQANSSSKLTDQLAENQLGLSPVSLVSLFTLEANTPSIFTLSKRSIPVIDIKLDRREHIQSNRPLSLSVYSGIYFVDRRLSANDAESESFVSIKEETETPLELLSVGTQIKYDFGSIYLKAGVEFQSLNEKFEYEQFEILDTVAVSGVIGQLIDAEGNSFDQIGTRFEENTLTSRWRNYNNHRLFTIPISLGYEKQVHSWSLSAEVQTLFNFAYSFTGKQLDEQIQVVEESSSLNKTFNLGLGVSLGVEYAFANAASIYLRPHYFRYKNSIGVETLNYSQHYHMLGFQLGLNYQL